MPHGESHPNAKLTASDVVEIRRRASEGETQVSLARKFGVRQTNISLIVTREAWSWLK